MKSFHNIIHTQINSTLSRILTAVFTTTSTDVTLHIQVLIMHEQDIYV